jgi:AcrR family transcriptional regulator
MPTGVALRDAREQLFGAAERVLLRAGPSGLTSRAVTTEAGCAKGVLHRHFADFDAFLAELVGNLTGALTEIFGPVALGILGLVTFRDDLRARLRQVTPAGLPVLTEAGAMIAAYLAAERDLSRVAADADVGMLALTLIGAGHLLFAGRAGAPPEAAEVRRVVDSVLAGVAG